MNKTIEMDPQEMSVYSSSSNKNPVSYINEYAMKNNLVPYYDLKRNCSSLGVVSFQYSLTLDKFVAVGEGLNKREAKHLAASNILKMMMDDNSQLLDTDFNKCAISPYDNNIQVNTVLTENNKAVDMDLQNMSVYSNSSNKNPVSYINEYAMKNNLVPYYDLKRNCSSLGVVSFQYRLTLGKHVAVGEGPSKKEAKHLAASNILKMMMDDNSQLLDTDFNKCAISPYDNNIQVNTVLTENNKAVDMDLQDMSVYSSSSNQNPVSYINEYAMKNNLVPYYDLKRNCSSLGVVSFQYRLTLGKLVAVGEGPSKKEAKHLAASNILKMMMDDNSQLLDTDFNKCAISPYDNNIQVNTVLTQNNKAVDMDLQDMSVYSNSANKNPMSILNEYATKNKLVLRLNLIHDGSSLGTVSFQYMLTMGKFVAVGEGPSKKEAKHLAASNILKKMMDDNSQLLNADFNECSILPYDKNIKVNYIVKLNDICRQNNIELAEYHLVKEERRDHKKLFTISCHVAEIIETATQSTKEQAENLAAFQMLNTLITSGTVIEKCKNVSDSIITLENVNNNSQLLDTDFNKCAISPYDNNIQVNTVLTENNKAVDMDLQDMSVYSNSSNKNPMSILNEYATKNNLVLRLNLIHDGSSLRTVSFQYMLTLGKFVAVGKGPSKKEAKHLAASNILKMMMDDNSQLLDTDFNKCAISPYDNNIQVNTVLTENNKAVDMDLQDMSVYSNSSNKNPMSILNEYATKNNLALRLNLIHDGSSLRTVSFQYMLTVGKFVALGEGPSKKEAKHLAASNILKKMKDYNSQLLDTDFNECAISPYDNNIQVNTVLTENNKAVDMDLPDMSVYSSSSNQNPVSYINEYARKNNLVPYYDLKRNCSSLGVVSFQYRLTLGKFVAVGEGPSKKEAKHLAASNILKMMMEDNSQLLDTDFNKCAISPYDNNIQVNTVLTENNKAVDMDLQNMSVYSNSSNKNLMSILNKYAAKNKLLLRLNLIHDGSSLSIVSFQYRLTLGKLVAVGEGPTKKEAKHLAASNILKMMMDDNSQSLDTDFNKCAISPYDNNIQVNTVLTENNKAVDMDLQNMSVYSNSSNKNLMSILNKYAAKNKLLLRLNLIHDGSSLSIVSFQYRLTLGKLVAVGEGPTKKEAKHLAASNILKMMMDDNSQSLDTDFNKCAISPYDNNIQVNTVLTENNKAVDMDLQDMSVYSNSSNKNPMSILNEYATKNKLVLRLNLIHDGSSLSTVSFQYMLTVGKFVALGEGPSKKEAKHLAASNILKKMKDYNSQLLDTDINECAISPYDNNIQVNTVLTENNKAVDMDLPDMSVYSSSSNQNPVSYINEYAMKNNLVPYYDFKRNCSSLGVVSFQYRLTLGKLVAVGEGPSKKEAKHLAASNILKKMKDYNSQLLDTDFNKCAISPYDNNIQVNTVLTENNKAVDMDLQDMSVYSNSSNKNLMSILNKYAAKNKLLLRLNLIHDGSSLSIVSFQYRLTLGKLVAVGEGPSKKEAKHLAASNILKMMMDDNSQLLDNDFNKCAISPYDNNIQVNTVLTENNKAVDMDLQDMSVYSNSSNKNPMSILNEYATKNKLVLRLNLIHDGSSLGTVSFQYMLTMGKFVAVGEGPSKKEAKHLAASNILKKMMDDNSQLLNADFNECSILPYDKNIKVNYIVKLNDICRQNNIELAEYHLVKEERRDHNKLFTISCHVAEIIETATQSTKEQAKNLAAFQMLNSLISSGTVIEKCKNVSDSIITLENVNKKSWPIEESVLKRTDCRDYHLVLKKTELKNSVTLNMVFNEYMKNGELNLPEPYNILQKIVTEHKINLNSRVDKIKLNTNNYQYSCTFALTDVYPYVYGFGVDKNLEMAQHIAVKELLIGICILLK